MPLNENHRSFDHIHSHQFYQQTWLHFHSMEHSTVVVVVNYFAVEDIDCRGQLKMPDLFAEAIFENEEIGGQIDNWLALIIWLRAGWMRFYSSQTYIWYIKKRITFHIWVSFVCDSIVIVIWFYLAFCICTCCCCGVGVTGGDLSNVASVKQLMPPFSSSVFTCAKCSRE